MNKSFKKGDVIRQFNVVGNKVMTTIRIGKKWVSNPSISTFIADGWQEFIAPIPEPYLPSIEELVERALRYGEDGGGLTYSINQEFEVQRRRDSHPQEFAEYNARVEACIAWANQQPHMEED